ncbi:MAG: AAA family ATPase [Leptospirales bacterium]
MIKVSGYNLDGILHQNKRTIIYSGRRESDNVEIILKSLAGEYPSPDQIANIKTEFKILDTIDAPNVIKPIKLIEYDGKPVIVMESVGGDSLGNLLAKEDLSIKKFLSLAISITDGIESIHEKKIIHKDINIHNIVWDTKNSRCKIIDFSLASDLAKESLPVLNASQLEGNLAYISPEQTGRMNRAIDYRTDYYSLGITLYKMATNVLPFDSEDPSELVHCHIAKVPPLPHEINNKIPKVISEIIMKLISKNAEDRYQSIHGLKYDLEKCATALKNNKITDFEIASHDVSNRLQFPDMLFGREKYVTELLENYYKCSRGSKQIMFYSGSSGVGKTAIVNEIQKTVIDQKGFFIRGKYDHQDKNTPYSAIIQAFNEMLKRILTLSEEELDVWRNQIRTALGHNGQVITEIIPIVEQIIGKQTQVATIPPVESQNRFNLTFRNFVEVFASVTHPLVFFLDDIHWADQASFELISFLMGEPDLRCILFIGTYRKNEVNDEHPFLLMLEKLKREKIPWTNNAIEPLDKDQILQMISAAFGKQSKDTKQLTDLVHSKTKGNPFFVREFLKTLHKANLIHYNNASKSTEDIGWQWDIKRIQDENITDNVVTLMVDNIKNLSPKTIEAMKVACCFGVRFDLDIVARVLSKSPAHVLSDLKEAINEGLLVKETTSISFIHGRVMDATYSLLDEKTDIHYRIGKESLLLHKEKGSGENLFNIASQWNRAIDHLSKEEKGQLVDINYKAGLKAKESAAYHDSAIFFTKGAELMPETVWESDYSFAFQFHKAWSEAEYLARNFDKAENLFKDILHHAKTILEKQQIYAIMMRHYITQMKAKQALDIGKATLKQLGIPLPGKPGKIYILKEIVKSQILLRRKKSKSIIDLPEMKDERIIAAIEIMGLCTTPALTVAPDYVPMIILKVFNLSLVHGIAPMSPFAIAIYGLILSSSMGNIKKGTEFGELAVNLSNKYQNNVGRAATFYTNYVGQLHLKIAFRDRSDAYKKAVNICLEDGNFEYYGYALWDYGQSLFSMGENLNNLSNQMEKIQKKIIPLKQPQTESGYNLVYQAVENLIGNSEDKYAINGEKFNAEENIALWEEKKDISTYGNYRLFTLILHYIFGSKPETLEIARQVEKNVDIFLSLQTTMLFYLFYGLLLSSLISKNSRNKRKHLSKLKKIIKKFKMWSDACPENYINKYILLQAELSRAENKPMGETTKLYLEAIKLSNDQQITHEVAIANELMAKYYLSNNLVEIARIYMTNAYYSYMKWGCQPKMEALKQEYPQLISMEALGFEDTTAGNNMSEVSTRSSILPSSSLDLASILKNSQAISQEIRLDELLKKMMRITIENAGAEKGYFLSQKQGMWHIEAANKLDDADVQVMQSTPIESPNSTPLVSIAIVNYVERTQNSIVLNDAENDTKFNNDPYIKKYKPKSVLCMPLIKQGQVVGIIYLENNLTTNAFPEERLEVLNLLSSQAAISIDNAGLYATLEDKVKERTNKLKNALEQLEHQNQDLEEANTKIMDSIQYAQMIQTSLLPNKQTVQKYLPNSFFIWKPRDIVGGDIIYTFFSETNFIVAVIDCTGHGVPGAFMTMIASTALKRIISEENCYVPNEILSRLNFIVKTTLQQETEFALSDDGLDAAICNINMKDNVVIYSGARVPVLYFSKGEAIIINGDRHSIGYKRSDLNFKFTNHTIPIEKGTSFFMSTDGLYNQIGGKDNIPFGKQRLKNLILKNNEKPIKDQETLLLSAFDDHMKGEDRLDDLAVFGFTL